MLCSTSAVAELLIFCVGHKTFIITILQIVIKTAASIGANYLGAVGATAPMGSIAAAVTQRSGLTVLSQSSYCAFHQGEMKYWRNHTALHLSTDVLCLMYFFYS